MLGLTLRATILSPKTISSGVRKMKTPNVGPQKCRAHVAINFPCRSVRRAGRSDALFSVPAFFLCSSPLLWDPTADRVALGQCRLPIATRPPSSFSNPTMLLRREETKEGR